LFELKSDGHEEGLLSYEKVYSGNYSHGHFDYHNVCLPDWTVMPEKNQAKEIIRIVSNLLC
jgi:hypothetical protein